MTKRDERLRRMLRNLETIKERGGKAVIWILNKDQKQYLENKGYEITPFLYQITIEKIETEEVDALVNEINTAYDNGYKTIYRSLGKDSVEELKKYGICARPYKYEIIL